jgi:hypothetical protein
VKTIITLEVTHTKPIPDLVEKIEGRAYTLDGVEDVRGIQRPGKFDPIPGKTIIDGPVYVWPTQPKENAA